MKKTHCILFQATLQAERNDSETQRSNYGHDRKKTPRGRCVLEERKEDLETGKCQTYQKELWWTGNLPISWWGNEATQSLQRWLEMYFKFGLLEEKQKSRACLGRGESEVHNLEWEGFWSSKYTFELLGAFSKWTWSQNTQKSSPNLGKNVIKSQCPMNNFQRMEEEAFRNIVKFLSKWVG